MKTMQAILTVLFVLAILAIIVFAYMKLPRFGRLPGGERLQLIQQSSNFKDGIFKNLNPTPQLAEDARFVEMFRDMLFSKNRRPQGKIPAVKTNLKSLNSDEDVLIWFGHSSYYVQLDGKKILVDPVFSGHASPFFFSLKAFPGTDIYSPDDFPEIDYLFITHDHWDHLDYKTVRKLRPKIKNVITGLGTGEHLERWGFSKNQIFENDWYESFSPEDGIQVTTTPARHFSGRGFRPKKSLWVSFVFQTPSYKLFIGGDSGYDNHFAEIGEQYGPFDMAILENGQYNKNWKYIHMMPEQVLQAAKDLNAKRLFPVHSSKFALANHPWDEPLKRIAKLNRNSEMPIITPKIGEKVRLNDITQSFDNWWEKVE